MQLGRPGIIAATAVEFGGELALFDTGAESNFENVASALRRIGFDVRDVRHVFLSHIHFDHAGAAWRFAVLGAKIYVHRRGAGHLIDPAKLVASATRIFGGNMETLWGRIAPVAEQSIRILEDMEIVRVGSSEVRALETPGHASHHHVYHWEDNVFGGDIAGVRLGKGPPIPPFVPPELHVESWHQSIARIRVLRPANLYLPHFGRVTDSIATHLDVLDERVHRWAEWFRDRLRHGDEEPQLIPAFAEYEAADLRAKGADDELVRDYECADPSYMAVAAALRYWRKYHPGEVSALGSK